MGEKLKNPPLVEVVCEFKFDPESSWDWTIPGQLFDHIKEEFPERSDVKGIGVEIRLDKNKQAATNIRPAPERVQLKRADTSAMVQVGENLLAINHFPPYPGWGTYKELILQILNKYYELGQGEAALLKQLGLRYINRIEAPPYPFLIEDFITLKPSLGGVLDRKLKNFFQRYEIQHDDPKGILVHQTGINEKDDKVFLMVDLDFTSTDVQNLNKVQEVEDWLGLAHDRIYESFRASLNPTFWETLG